MHVYPKNIFIHADYAGWTDDAKKEDGHNDLCLLRTMLPLNKPKVWAPICLPDKPWEHGEACHVSGWGATTAITGFSRLKS